MDVYREDRLLQLPGVHPPRSSAPTVDERPGTFAFTTTEGQRIYLPQPHLSPSQVEMYLKCPRQYFFRYVMGQKSPPGVAQVEGASHHVALELNNVHQIKEHAVLPTEKVVECFQDTFTSTCREIEDWEGEQKDVVLQRGKPILEAYMKNLAPTLLPVASELKFEIPLHGIPYLGYIDLLDDGEQRVWDYKVVSSRSPYLKSGVVEKSLQLTSYAWAVKQNSLLPQPDVGFIALVKDKGKVERRRAGRTPGDLAMLEETVLLVAKAISAGAFPLCSPESWACSEKYCGYWSRCRGRYDGAH